MARPPPRLAAKLAVAAAVAAVLLCCARGAAEKPPKKAYWYKKSGSCLSYGHACWGAHGKRSGNQHFLQTREQDSPNGRDLTKSRWFLSKLIQNPVEIRYLLQNGIESRRRGNQQFKKDVGADGIDKGQDDWGKVQPFANDEDLFEDLNLADDRNQDKIVQNPKYLDKRSADKI